MLFCGYGDLSSFVRLIGGRLGDGVGFFEDIFVKIWSYVLIPGSTVEIIILEEGFILCKVLFYTFSLIIVALRKTKIR